MEQCSVGPFKLPGIAFEKGELPEDLLQEMQAWANAEGVGMSMTERLWSFKKEAHREWFILRWSDDISKRCKKELQLEQDFGKEIETLFGKLNVQKGPNA